MKKIVIILGIILNANHSFAQSSDNIISSNKRLNVTIIGTSHNGNKRITDDSLFNILYKINPDIVFEEIGPSGFHTPFYMKLGLLFGIGHYEIEYLAFKKLKQANVKFQLLPYDIEIKRRFNYIKQYSRNDKAITNAVNVSYRSNKLNNFEKQQIIKCVTPENYVTKRINDSALFCLNQKDVTDSTRKFYYLFKTEMLPLMDSNDSFKGVREIAKKTAEFWEERNKKMAENILNHMKKFEEKKTIIIVCGQHHKYYLEDLLKPQQEKYNFKLYDYWQLSKE